MHKDTPEEGIHHPLNVLLMFLELEDGEVEVNFICTPIAKTTDTERQLPPASYLPQDPAQTPGILCPFKTSNSTKKLNAQ